MKARVRFPTARRRFLEGRLPLASILVGPAPTRAELISLATLHTDTVVLAADAAELTATLTAPPGARRLAVVLYALGEPHYAALDAVRALSGARGLRLVTWSEQAPHDAWAQVIATQVECRLTAKELHTWVQVSLGGTLGVTATELLDRVGWTVEAAGRAMAQLSGIEHPSLGDVRELIEPDPELHFVGAVTRCDLRRARALLPRVTRVADVLGELEHTLMQLWALGEIRPLSRLNHPRDVASWANVEPERIKELAPHVRLYSRQKVAHRLGALAAVDRELRRGAPTTGLLEALCATW